MEILIVLLDGVLLHHHDSDSPTRQNYSMCFHRGLSGLTQHAQLYLSHLHVVSSLLYHTTTGPESHMARYFLYSALILTRVP